MNNKYINHEYLSYSTDRKVQLDDKFIFAFKYFDGFTHRLLDFTLYIDKDYNYILHLTAFQRTALNDHGDFCLTFESSLPNNIKQSLSILINGNFENIFNEYLEEHLGASGQGSTRIFYNSNGNTKPIHVSNNLENTSYLFKSKNEKRLFKLIQLIRDWVKNFYQLITIEK